MPNYPYKNAHLVESKNGKWYIVFYVWDALKGMLLRKRDYEVNNYLTKSDRRLATLNSYS